LLVNDPNAPLFTLEVWDTLSADDQVYNNYGPKANDELLLGYGFAIQDNLVEQVFLKLLDSGTASRSNHIPFGMGEYALRGVGGLRKRNNLLGLYPNDVPFFQGIPSAFVHHFFSSALSIREISWQIQPTQMTGRLVLGTLLYLYEAISSECIRKPYEYERPSLSQCSSPQQYFDFYAWIYRHGQRDISHSIRRELKAVLAKLRVESDESGTLKHPEALRTSPSIVTLSDALWQLRRENPIYHKLFKEGMHSLYKVDVNNPEELEKSGHEGHIWVFLLIVFRRVERYVTHLLVKFDKTQEMSPLFPQCFYSSVLSLANCGAALTLILTRIYLRRC
jgi:hypothetical protein